MTARIRRRAEAGNNPLALGDPAWLAAIDEPADLRLVMSASLSARAGGPSMSLLRSDEQQRMEIRFDGVRPGEQFQTLLGEEGWTNGVEGVWSKPAGDGKWQSLADMERLFQQIARAIREEKGLAGHSAA